MGVLDWLGLREAADDPEMKRLKGEVETLSFRLEESYEQLSRMFSEDAGWSRIGEQTERDLTPEGRKQATQICRVMAIANPLIARAIAVRTGYIHGNGGIGVQAADGKETGTQDVNSVLQAFLDDPGNRAAFTGHQAHEEWEKKLATDGNVYAILFTNPQTGFVRVRTLDSLEVTDIITNPQDASEPWFYRRDYEETTIGERTSRVTTRQKTVWYPALGYTPTRRMPVIDGNPVDWSGSTGSGTRSQPFPGRAHTRGSSTTGRNSRRLSPASRGNSPGNAPQRSRRARHSTVSPRLAVSSAWTRTPNSRPSRRPGPRSTPNPVDHSQRWSPVRLVSRSPRSSPTRAKPVHARSRRPSTSRPD